MDYYASAARGAKRKKVGVFFLSFHGGAPSPATMSLTQTTVVVKRLRRELFAFFRGKCFFCFSLPVAFLFCFLLGSGHDKDAVHAQLALFPQLLVSAAFFFSFLLKLL